MTKKEFAQIVLAIQTYFPKENLFQTEASITLWYNALQDIEYNVMSTALQKWVATNKWSPSISELRDCCLTVSYGELPDWGEAYESVMRAIRNFGYQRETEALASLDDLTRNVVKRLGYKTLCMSNIENQKTDRANFRMLYEEIAKREREQMQIPVKIRDTIEQTKQAMIEG